MASTLVSGMASATQLRGLCCSRRLDGTRVSIGARQPMLGMSRRTVSKVSGIAWATRIWDGIIKLTLPVAFQWFFHKSISAVDGN